MMKKIVLILVLLVCIFLFSSCTSTSCVSLGGKTELDLPEGEKLLNISWQSNSDLWILVTAREENEEPKTYYFYQWGGIIQSGGLTIKEH